MLEPGTVIADKYRLERVLGRGGMGMVVEARHVQLGTSFALKFLHHRFVAKASLAERFFREARATAALRSEHVCRVFDVGTFLETPYIVMERLEGTDLARVLQQETRLPIERACDYVIQACAGIAEAHAAQIVHRDLKPGNLFVTERADGAPLVKILDFGIAKAPQEVDVDLTGTDMVLGSPSYMSLEQLRSSKLVDARSDIWSLGVILFEMVAGRKPFVGESMADLAVKIAMQPVPRLPEGPAALDDVIGRCLARDPAQRYQDVGALARSLALFADEPARRLAASVGRAARGASLWTPGSGKAMPAEASSPLPPAASSIPTAALSALSTETVSAVPDADPAGGRPSLMPTLRLRGSGDRDVSTGEAVKQGPGTTMQVSGAIENASAAGGSHRRVGAVIVAVSIGIGVWLGFVASGEDAGSAAPSATGLAEPADAAPLASPPPPPLSIEPIAPPVSAPDAALDPSGEDLAIEMEPMEQQPAAQQPVAPVPSSVKAPSPGASKRKPAPSSSKGSARDWSKSRL